jgi:hypothetical protein
LPPVTRQNLHQLANGSGRSSGIGIAATRAADTGIRVVVEQLIQTIDDIRGIDLSACFRHPQRQTDDGKRHGNENQQVATHFDFPCGEKVVRRRTSES